MTKTFKLKAEMVVTYTYDVEAETLEEAIEAVEADDGQHCDEVDSSAPRVTKYAIEGQMGWNDREDMA